MAAINVHEKPDTITVDELIHLFQIKGSRLVDPSLPD